MAKISKPVGGIALLAVVSGIAFYFLTEPDSTRRRVVRNTPSTRTTAPPGFPESDMTASFPRLTSPLRDAFVPKVVVKKPTLAGIGGGMPGVVKPTWALTGVYIYNGVKLALLENTSTGDSKTVKAGESWMGQQILSVTPKGVLLANGAQMVFEEPPVEAPVSVPPVLLPNGLTVPGNGVLRQGVAGDPQTNRPTILNLPPPVAPTQPTGSRS